MTRGLYIGASGMLAETQRQNIIANNLANVNTTGYKKDIPLSKEFPSMLIRRIREDRFHVTPTRIIEQRPVVGVLGLGVIPDDTAHDFIAPSPLIETGNRFDLAIQGDGFFAIQTKFGVRYTRKGNFLLDEQGQLVTTEGNLVLGQNGPVKIRSANVQFDEEGNIFVDESLVGTLQIVDFPKPYPLSKVGNNMFIPVDANVTAQSAINAQLKSGFLEGSNVNVVTEMVDMITALRAYEANQRVITAQNETLGRAINDVGRS